MTTSLTTVRPKNFVDVMSLLLVQAAEHSEASYEFRGVTYGATVTTDERDRSSAELWKMNRCGTRVWTVCINQEGVIDCIIAPDGEEVNPATLSDEEWWTLCVSLGI